MALTQISTAGVKDDAVTSGKIPANAVGSSELADNAVDTAAIANDAVTSDKIPDNAVQNEHIADNSVGSDAIANGSVRTAEIQDEAVTLAKLEHGTSSNDGKFLRANNGADPSFETVTSTTINNNADNRVITGSGTANTLNGESSVLIDSSSRIQRGSDPSNLGTAALNIVDSQGYGINISRNQGAACTNNQRMGAIAFHSGLGSQSTTTGGATIEAFAEEDQSGSTNATRLVFSTKSSGTGPGSAPTERMRIASGGNVFIGTTTSAAGQLIVKDSSGNQFWGIGRSSDGNASISFRNNADDAYNGRIESDDSTGMNFEIAGTQQMRIDRSGNVLIHSNGLNNSSVSGQALQISGTTRPTLILRGNSSGGNTGEIQFADNSGSDSDSGTRVGLIKYEHAGTYANHMHFHTSETERVVISHDGKLGVDNSPANLAGFAERLQVTGAYSNQYAAAFKIRQSSGSLMRFSTTNSTSGDFQLCGSITVNGTSTSFNTSSDYRLKENDVKISDGITRVKQLRPIRFNWKADSSTTEDGFFAHEVEPIVPESVSGKKDATVDAIGEGYQKIDHSKLIPLLTAALQEAIAKIEVLETKVAALEAA